MRLPQLPTPAPAAGGRGGLASGFPFTVHLLRGAGRCALPSALGSTRRLASLGVLVWKHPPSGGVRRWGKLAHEHYC